LNGIFKNNISNFALSLLTMPQRFYLDEFFIACSGNIQQIIKVPCILYSCTSILSL